ncbi:MAG: DUF3102 domain-containing protein [Faecousia sp.]
MTEIKNVRTLDTVAAEIRTFTASMLVNILEIGRRLCEAKEMVPYGQFGTWVEENTGYSRSTANNFMRLFQEYGSAQGSLFGAEIEDVQTFGKLSYTKALALLQLPAAEREEFVAENPVESMSTRELEQAIRERDEAIRRAEEAEGEKSKAKLSEMNAQKERAVIENELLAAQDMIKELESRPVEVAVQEPDPAEVQKQIDAAVKEAEDAARKKQKELKDKLAASEKRSKELETELESQKKAAGEAEKKLVEQQTGIINMEKERLEREIEGLKKQLVLSDAAVASFHTLFDQSRDILSRMAEAASKIADGQTAGKCRAAAKKLLEMCIDALEADNEEIEHEQTDN